MSSAPIDRLLRDQSLRHPTAPTSYSVVSAVGMSQHRCYVPGIPICSQHERHDTIYGECVSHSSFDPGSVCGSVSPWPRCRWVLGPVQTVRHPNLMLALLSVVLYPNEQPVYRRSYRGSRDAVEHGYRHTPAKSVPAGRACRKAQIKRDKVVGVQHRGGAV